MRRHECDDSGCAVLPLPKRHPKRRNPARPPNVGNYRIIYTVHDDVLLVVVVTLGHRRDAYDR
ncbi:type II toxin-antitoxin system RelE/ParE family toxin [Agromyces neolithicus]